MNLFPRTLARIPYLVRSLIFGIGVAIIFGVLGALMAPMMPTEGSDASIGIGVVILGIVMAVVGIAAAVYGIIGLNIPRIRSCGWSPWLVLILFIPGVGGIFGLVLLFVPPVDPNAP